MSTDHNIIIKNTDILPKLSEVLDLIFKKTKSCAAIHDGYCFNMVQLKRSGLLGRNSVSAINECLLNHRFDEATKLLWIMCQDRCSFDLVLYKGIMVALDNLITSDEIETFKTITRDIRKLKSVNKLELQLEYLLYVLKKDMNCEEDLYYLEGKNARKRKIKIIPCIEQLYTAYSALISYITWANISQNEQYSESNKEFASPIIHSFKQLIYNPGVWDIFVLKLVEIKIIMKGIDSNEGNCERFLKELKKFSFNMLEYYEQYDELEEILKKYVEVNPKHLNAYIYLCVHLHKHSAEPEVFIQYAKILANLCPSDERVLLLVLKWDELGKNLKKCLKILFAFLDYPINGRRVLGWHLLSTHLHTAISRKEPSLIDLLNSLWKQRSSSWSFIHFKLSNISTDPFELIQKKMKVLILIQPDHEYIKNAKEKFPAMKENVLQNGDSSPTAEDFKSLYILHNSRCS